MNDRLEKTEARLEKLTFKNGKVIVLLNYIRDNFDDILKDAVSPPFDPDCAMALVIHNEKSVMFYLVKKNLLDVTIFGNGEPLSKKIKTDNINEIREFLLQTQNKGL